MLLRAGHFCSVKPQLREGTHCWFRSTLIVLLVSFFHTYVVFYIQLQMVIHDISQLLWRSQLELSSCCLISWFLDVFKTILCKSINNSYYQMNLKLNKCWSALTFKRVPISWNFFTSIWIPCNSIPRMLGKHFKIRY